ncbi:RidA family protein [Pedobacter heparinus]|uniref:Endoribonuclease L-PSP n=1 Tax=Pedobacter heparinus (strain ATCC 13125 / DSM 2366 / CIP 104194 / JCM 7457 / NBRC 12017 / NCIMB 9290 / NRRL B-14731 / HIM 762-3) TaxID=485917 RepID=C6XVC7_PEDHD|nr:RidA family protein [Pedobacter heparinus]ACU03993.1 Endoribonuclease L-PSP [Pedobacter heparinus DSM 2366]
MKTCPLIFLLVPLCLAGCSIERKTYNPTGAAFSQAYGIKNYKQLVFVSGQVPEDEKENIPDNFRDQAALAWKNVETQLKAAKMGLKNIVKYTIYLSDRKYRRENYEVRYKVLGDHQPAMSIVITGIYDEKWLLEIEAIAAK